MNHHLLQDVTTKGEPLDKADAVVLLLHGRNQTVDYVLELANRINLTGIHYIGLQAEKMSWYPKGFMAEIKENEPYLSYALEACHTRISDLLMSGVPLSKIVLLGFSQGACLAAEYCIRHPGRYGGIVLFTGGVVGPEGTRWNDQGDFQGTPVFLGTSDIDSWVPVDRVHETEELFRSMGAQTIKRIYQGMDHLVNDEEISYARSIIQAVQNS